jgi:hypothetical protein
MYAVIIAILLVGAVAVAYVALKVFRSKNIDVIVLGALRRRTEPYEGLRHVFFCFVDHYEPLWGGADERTGLERVKVWHENYAKSVDGFRDNSGRAPQHTYFYPEEEYAPQYLDLLGDLCAQGFGDVEVHLHHDNDTSDGFRQKIESFTKTLHERHGFLKRNQRTGLLEYGFIHGNWALDDSGADGRWCGVKDEITILKETGCYADFTYPSAPHPSQPPMTNRIYYATDDPLRARSHHSGVDAAYGQAPAGDLLMINGPLTLNWRWRKKNIFPHIENGDITGNYPPAKSRCDLWVRTGIAVKGWPRWVFIKIHTHGTQDHNSELLLGRRVRPLYENLLDHYNDGERHIMHFVTARELYACIRAVESADNARIQAIENFNYAMAEQPS